MTNMQHYMDDIDDLLDGLNGEMTRRLLKINKWDAQIKENAAEIRRLESFVFDTSNSMEIRQSKLFKLAELKGRVRELTERKISLADRNQKTVQAIYSRISELAYHCKCEVEIDNPGCTELRERLFCQSVQLQNEPPPPKRNREMSAVMTDDDRASTRSGTPMLGRESSRSSKKRVGRPRNGLAPFGSAFSSARSSMEKELAGNATGSGTSGSSNKKLSKYMRKKQEKLRLAEEMKAFEIKNELIDEDEGATWKAAADSTTKTLDFDQDEERDLLDCLLPGFEGLQSPADGIMDSLDASMFYSMDMYPPDHNQTGGTDHFQAPAPVPPASRRTNHTAAAVAAPSAMIGSSSGGTERKRQQHTLLFGSIPDTSFSGRPRKLTDRVTEMIQSNREKEGRQKVQQQQQQQIQQVQVQQVVKREPDEWCICGGQNAMSDMMVECENMNCPVEWFHFECVGLSSVPSAEWFCPECARLPAQQRAPRRLDEQ